MLTVMMTVMITVMTVMMAVMLSDNYDSNGDNDVNSGDNSESVLYQEAPSTACLENELKRTRGLGSESSGMCLNDIIASSYCYY